MRYLIDTNILRDFIATKQRNWKRPLPWMGAIGTVHGSDRSHIMMRGL